MQGYSAAGGKLATQKHLCQLIHHLEKLTICCFRTMVIPFLGLEPLGQAPPGRVVSEAEAIQLIWGHVNSDFRGFRGIAGVSCKLSGRKSVCLESGGCRERGVPCLVFKVKEQWVEAGIPTFNEDRQIISKLSNLKSLFDKKNTTKS